MGKNRRKKNIMDFHSKLQVGWIDFNSKFVLKKVLNEIV